MRRLYPVALAAAFLAGCAQHGGHHGHGHDHGQGHGAPVDAQAVLQQAERDFDPLPFDAACARAFGSVAASLRARGRKVRARGLDALIAATAVANGLPLYTCHPGDFEAIVGLEVVAVPSPE